MPEYKTNFVIEMENPKEAAEINQMLKHMVTKMDKTVLLHAARKINANPVKKIKRLESGVFVL